MKANETNETNDEDEQNVQVHFMLRVNVALAALRHALS